MTNMVRRINTFHDYLMFEKAARGGILPIDALSDILGDPDWMEKTTLGTAGVFNRIFGAKVAFNADAMNTAWGALEKRPWESSGKRIVTALQGNRTAGLGVADGAAIPAADDDTFDTAVYTLKHLIGTPTNISTGFEALQGKDDLLSVEADLEAFGQGYAQGLDNDLLGDAGVVAGDNMESLARLTGGDAAAEALEDAGDLDIYAFDRSAGEFAAQVDSNAAGRVLSPALVDGIHRDVLAFTRPCDWPNNHFWLTHPTTTERFFRNFDTEIRYTAGAVQFGSNGLTVSAPPSGPPSKTPLEVNMGRLPMYRDIPWVSDDQVVASTGDNGAIPPIMLVCKRHAWISVARATQLFTSEGQMVALGSLNTEHLLKTEAELVANRSICMGQLRDIT